MEVPGPGLFAKASRPLEASIKICPTLELTNSLPYYVTGYLIMLSGLIREPEATNTNVHITHQEAARTATSNVDGVPASTSTKRIGGGATLSLEPKRVLRSRRSGPLLLDEADQAFNEQQIVANFSLLMRMLKIRVLDFHREVRNEINGLKRACPDACTSVCGLWSHAPSTIVHVRSSAITVLLRACAACHVPLDTYPRLFTLAVFLYRCTISVLYRPA